MADQAEHAFIKTFVNTISTQPVTYGDDYQQPPENSLRRVPILPIDVPPPPAPKEAAPSSSSSATLNLIIKSTKPPVTYTLSGIHSTDTIAAIKQHLSTTNPTAPSPDAQRLLLKGKALADNKLLKEYTVNDGDTINLMVKPGVDWNPSAPAPALPVPAVKTPQTLEMPLPQAASTSSISSTGSRRHQRIPSVVLSPSPSNDDLDTSPKKDVLLTLDTDNLGLGLGTGTAPKETLGSYHLTISNPAFWEKMLVFLRSEFTREADALTAFEDFLAASKGSLSASDIARIRDQVGVVGMAGT